MTYKNENTKIANRKARNSGITLVALVVTIVVLLILAGITITMLFSENGIITKAREAADATNNADKDTEQGLENLANDMNTAIGGNSSGSKVEVGKLVPIDTKFEKYTDDTSSTPVPIPGGYCVVNDSSANTNNKNTIASGLVISDLANDTLDNELIDSKRGNQFVWVPVSSSELNRMYDSTNKRGNLYDFGSSSATKNPPTLRNYSPTGYREPDIVTGNSDGTGTSYDGSTTYLNILTDFTVEEGQTKTADLFKEYLQNEFDSMISSVQKYGGFYIGRYETGNLSSSNNTVKAVVQKGATVGNANWYYQYQEIKNMAKDNKNITTSMIWGCQFDRTLEWIAQTNQKEGKPDYSLLTDSRSWGNYSDSTGAAEENRGGKRTSGYNEAWQKNHIYDLAGNAFDWTIEASNTTDCRVGRGGSYYDSGTDYPASYRSSYGPGDSDGLYR